MYAHFLFAWLLYNQRNSCFADCLFPFVLTLAFLDLGLQVGLLRIIDQNKPTTGTYQLFEEMLHQY